MSLQVKKLNKVAEFIRGITFLPKDLVDNFTKDIVGVMRTKNVQKVLDLSDVWKINKKLVRHKKQYLEEGDLLISSANSWNLVGKTSFVHALKFPCSFGGFVTVLRGDEKIINRRYLYYWLVSEKIQTLLRSFSNKTTNISNLDLKRTYELNIPLPSLMEQQHITAQLDSTNNILRLSNETIAKLDDLKKSIFVQMFGDPILNSKKIKTKKVKEICNLINGLAFKPSEWEDKGLPIIRIQNLNNENKPFNYTQKKFDKKYLIKNGDILFSWSGTPGTSFGCFMWNRENGWLNQHIFKVQLDTKILNPDFFILQMNLKINVLIAQAHGGVGLKHVKKGMVESLDLITPTIEEQNKFSNILNVIKKNQDISKKLYIKKKNLLSSLQHQVFTIN
jgi:type I restriction enzyme S subunit